jgi:hypothetical protein
MRQKIRRRRRRRKAKTCSMKLTCPTLKISTNQDLEEHIGQV